MAISIDYSTKVISVPKADLTLIQSSPSEIREMDLNWFRLQLKDWEDNALGMVMPTTHNHVAPISVGGVTLARVIELINGYTVTFEDGQYAVNIAGGNSNVGDNVNLNQVSVRSANSAGLVQSREIEFASFQGGVWVDATSSTVGTVYPAGTARSPVNNLSDAKLIADLNGFTVFFILGDITVSSGAFNAYTFIGQGKNLSTIVLDAAATIVNCVFENAHIDGTMDGECVFRYCAIDNVNYVSGFIESCVLEPGVITLGGNTVAHFLDCYSGVPGVATPTIDCGGDGPALTLRNYNGGIAIRNKTGGDAVSIDLNSGQVVLENTVTNGTIVIRGVGKLVDNSSGATVVSENLIQGSMTQSEKVKLDEMHKDRGLDSTSPKTITEVVAGTSYSESVGGVSKTVVKSGSTTTITRSP